MNLEELQKSLQEAIGKLRPIARLSEEAIAFQENVKHHRFEFIGYKEPMMQVFVGAKNSRDRWLEASVENQNMLRCVPDFLFIKDSIPRYNFYEFKSYYEKRYLRIFPNGFVVSHFPCVEWGEKSTATIHELMSYIGGLFIFANRIMKHRDIKQSQRIRIEISGLEDSPCSLRRNV